MPSVFSLVLAVLLETPVSQLWGAERLISLHPLIYAVDDFISEEENQRLLELLDTCHAGKWNDGCKEIRANLHIKRNNTTSEGSSKPPLRNSTSFQLTLEGELEPTVDAIVRRAHLLARHPVTYGEGVQIADYVEGEYYGFHHDSLQRRATFLMYLRDIPEDAGGETIFPMVRAPSVADDAEPPLPPAVSGWDRGEYLDYKIDKMEDMMPYCQSDFYLKIRPKARTAILFFGYKPDKNMDISAVHASCPIRGPYHKSILQRWMRFGENSLFAKANESVRAVRTLLGSGRMISPKEAATTTEAPLLRRGTTTDDTLATAKAASNLRIKALMENMSDKVLEL